ncbi:TPA: hypothetical protein L7V51_000962 [Klebsiella pneumoniae]|nr:hypothetical protein [Klebsiella pneumoniae]
MDTYTINKISDEDELFSIITANTQKENEIALLLDSTKCTGGDTLEFLQFMKENHENVKVYGDADNVNFVQLNSVIISIGTVFATTVAVPIILNLISNFLQKKIDRFGSRDIELRVSIIKQEADGSLNKIDIAGKADDVLEVVSRLN